MHALTIIHNVPYSEMTYEIQHFKSNISINLQTHAEAVKVPLS